MLSRRSLIVGLSSALVLPRLARAQSVTDATGRALTIPTNVTRVLPAGPPAAIMLYTLAPELLIGWPRANRPEEREYLLPDIGSRPEIGRTTRRGNTANLEVVLALKPDLILDVGSTTPTYVTLAERVQEQTGIPYALLDGRFEAKAASYRKLGELIRRVPQGEMLANYTARTLETITQRIAIIATDKRPRVYFTRGRRAPGWPRHGIDRAGNVQTLRDKRTGAVAFLPG